MLSGIAPVITTVTLSGIAVYAILRLVRYGRSGNWPETDGRVESYGRYRHLDDAGSRSLSFCDVAYSYSVGGQFYSGQFLSPTLQNDAALTAYLQQQIPVGRAVKVRYHPGHPERSIIGEEFSARENEITQLNLE